MRVRTRLAALTAAIGSLLLGGCESALFAFANKGVDPPEASVAFAPEQGLSLDVYRPQGTGRTAAPVVVFFYGGGWTRGARDQYAFVGRRLAQNGVLAIVADYRLHPQTTFPGFVEDGAKAVRWARDNAVAYGGDAGRLYVMGHSAGAQIGGLIATDPRYLAAQGMKRSDLAGFIGMAGPFDFTVGKYAPIFGPPAQWPQAMTLNYVDAGAPPMLLIHGTDDDVTWPRNSTRVADKARAAGVRTELLLIEGGKHTTSVQAFFNPERSPTVLPAVLAFVRGGAGGQ